VRILIIEDEPRLLRSLAKALREEDYAVDTAEAVDEGLYKAESYDYDAVVLDVMLPVLDGWTVLERLRTKKQTPVLMLTARDAPRDRVRGLDTGANDYLVKPFDLLGHDLIATRRGQGYCIEELEQRVSVLSRAVRGGTPPNHGPSHLPLDGRHDGAGFDFGNGSRPPPPRGRTDPPSDGPRGMRMGPRDFRLSPEDASLFDEGRDKLLGTTSFDKPPSKLIPHAPETRARSRSAQR
jgi:CheY-like chemotaxis protein